MICFRCDNEDCFHVEEREIEQVYRGYTIKVKTPLTICNNCGWECLDIGQTDELLKRLNEYSNYGEGKEYDTLYDADPNCKHYIEPQWSGIKCIRCNGWYCL